MIKTIATLWSLLIGYCVFGSPNSADVVGMLGMIWIIGLVPLSLLGSIFKKS
jgi:hypothetical protein